MDHEFAGVKAGRKFEPEAHATFGTSPARTFGHVFAEGLIESLQTQRVGFAHAREMFLEQAALEKFGESGLRELVGVQVGHLLDETEAFDSGGRSHNPADAQAGERNFREAIDVNDDVGAVELLQRRHAFFACVEAGVDMVFHDGDLIARGKFENATARRERHGSAGGILEIGSEDEKLDAIGGERGFERFEIDAKRSCRVRGECGQERRGSEHALH